MGEADVQGVLADGASLFLVMIAATRKTKVKPLPCMSRSELRGALHAAFACPVTMFALSCFVPAIAVSDRRRFRGVTSW